MHRCHLRVLVKVNESEDLVCVVEVEIGSKIWLDGKTILSSPRSVRHVGSCVFTRVRG